MKLLLLHNLARLCRYNFGLVSMTRDLPRGVNVNLANGCNHLWVMVGGRLTKSVNNCSAPNSRATAPAENGRTAVRQCRAMPNPVAAATPMMSVIAISVGEKCHHWSFVHLNKNSHTIIMAASQMTKQGSADHFANSLPRNPSTMGIHSGSVCTMLRSTPWRTTPTT